MHNEFLSILRRFHLVSYASNPGLFFFSSLNKNGYQSFFDFLSNSGTSVIKSNVVTFCRDIVWTIPSALNTNSCAESLLGEPVDDRGQFCLTVEWLRIARAQSLARHPAATRRPNPVRGETTSLNGRCYLPSSGWLIAWSCTGRARSCAGCTPKRVTRCATATISPQA